MSPASYATKLRKQLRQGKPLDADDGAWLHEYEAKTKRGRKPAARPDISDSPPADLPPPESAAGGDAPPSETPPPVGDTVPPPIDVGGGEAPGVKPPGDGAGKPPPSPPPEPEKKDKEEDAAHAQMCAMLAGAYGKWLKDAHADLARRGAPALPPAVVDGILVPCCYRAAVHFLPRINSVYLDAGATVAGGMYTLVMKRRLDAMESSGIKPQAPRQNVINMVPPQRQAAPPPQNPPQAPAYPAARESAGEEAPPSNPFGI